MSSSFGGTVKLKGETEYKKALKDITNNLKVMSSEIKLTASEFSKSDNAVENSKNKSKNLNKQIDQQVQTILGLQEGLKLARKEYGDNSREVANWQSKLNLAKADLNKLNSELEENEKSLNDTEDNFDDAGNSALKFGDILKANVLGNVITGGLKKLVSAVKEVGSTILNVGKEALNSYADYEQLVGGVETLFKDNAETVENYANNAYKTAGLSANDYMNTVTSFSASLLQSLNNDTAKTAQVADMAITDMSDNANKMGTDMSMIQNAYQGFAKQNYTMLDNLKLGYGGTKTEMQRLLADAEKVTGIKYDINNLNDVYQAIHVIQGELGITGTTAKEASTTIQGSVSAMKSAWQNILTGIATGNTENMGNLVNNLANSVITAAQNILPRVQEIASGIVSVLPQIIEQINENLPILLNAVKTGLQAIIDILPMVNDAISSLIPEIISTLVSMLPQLFDVGIKGIVSLVEGISSQLPTLIPQMVEAILTMVETLLDNIDLLVDAGISLIEGLSDGLLTALPILIDKAPILIDKLITALTNNAPKLLEMGVKLVIKLAEGLIKAIPQLISKIPQIISSLVHGFANYFSNMHEVGKNLVSGIWEGIKNAKNWLLDKVKEWCGNILNGIKAFFGIHSPSKVFKDEIGTNLALGVGEGFKNTMKNVSDEMSASIPTEFDVTSTMKRTDNVNQLSLDNLTNAFISAVKNLNAQIIIDKDVAGRFIITSVNNRLGEIY